MLRGARLGLGVHPQPRPSASTLPRLPLRIAGREVAVASGEADGGVEGCSNSGFRRVTLT